ncbi:hypothetical protein CMI48_00070 [Candidatus Pacearchaeota archaeon]|nr:hypothetical protein [Candidatus Pacearchaeota archaeon]
MASPSTHPHIWSYRRLAYADYHCRTMLHVGRKGFLCRRWNGFWLVSASEGEAYRNVSYEKEAYAKEKTLKLPKKLT